MTKKITMTEDSAKMVVKTAKEVLGSYCERISLEGARKVANWIFNSTGYPVTTLFVERVWNEFADSETGIKSYTAWNE